MTRRLYSPAESNYALEIAGDLPWPMVPTFYNRWAQKHGYPTRTPSSLRNHIDGNGGTITAVGAWVTTGGIGSMLGIHPSIPVSWVLKFRPLLRPYQAPRRDGAARRGRIYVRRDRLRALAHLHPELYAGIPADRLLMLLELPHVVEHITESCPVRRTYTRPVRCVETGQTFPSRTAAAAAFHLSPAAISDVARGRRPAAAGFHFVEVGA